MNKIILILVAFIMFILTFAAWDIRNNNIISISKANASIFSDIRDAIKGHASDIKDRILIDDEYATGMTEQTAKFEYTQDDGIHWAKGSVSLVKDVDKYYIQLNSDFEAGLAPDLYLYITNHSIVTNQKQFESSKVIEVAKLKKGKGATYYELPRMTKVKSIIIHCKRFNEFMGSAVL